MAWRVELREVLSVYDVCGFQLAETTVSKPPQGGLRESGVRTEPARARTHRRGTTSAYFRGVLPFRYPSIKPPVDHLLDVGHIGDFQTRQKI